MSHAIRMRKKIENAALATSVIIGALGAGRLGAWVPAWNQRDRSVGDSTIAFVSNRHSPAADPQRALLAAEIYLMDADGAHARRLTQNSAFDGFPSLSPDGKRIVFDSHRLRAETEPLNSSDLFVMKTDGTEQTQLTQGSSATWSPDSTTIAFHASSSGAGRPIKPDPGAATSDSDIFVMNVSDFLEKGVRPRNITDNPAAIDDDADWSPSGQKVLFTSHAVTDDPQNSVTAEIYVINANGTEKASRLTHNSEEERGPAWSPDGTRILFMCRKGSPAPGSVLPTFELCVMNADGTDVTRLTNNAVPELTPSWSPDGRQIVFHRPVEGRGQFQLFVMKADGTGEKQLTFPPGLSGFANWGEIPGRDPRR
jgi:Tol biopolymer transport system component